MRRLRFWGFNASPEIVAGSLGELERDLLEYAWSAGEVTVRDACRDRFPDVAYTTVMTTMDRLFRKGLLTRRKVNRAFVYRTVATRAQLEDAMANELVQALLSLRTEPLPILSSLVDAVSDRDRALLGTLEELIREKRKKLDEGQEA